METGYDLFMALCRNVYSSEHVKQLFTYGNVYESMTIDETNLDAYHGYFLIHVSKSAGLIILSSVYRLPMCDVWCVTEHGQVRAYVRLPKL